MEHIIAIASGILGVAVLFVFFGIYFTLKAILREIREMNGKKEGAQHLYGKR